MKLIFTKEQVNKIAEDKGWKMITWQEDIAMASFYKEKMRVNVYLTTMSVATSLDHPKKGKTQLFRKKVNLKLLTRIFENPRVHTGSGYYTKNQTK